MAFVFPSNPGPLILKDVIDEEGVTISFLTPVLKPEERQEIMSLLRSAERDDELLRQAKRKRDQLVEEEEHQRAEEQEKIINDIIDRNKDKDIDSIAKKLICGWPEGELTTEDGKPIDFSNDQYDRLVGVFPSLPSRIVNAWMTQIFNGGNKKKSSKPSRRGG